MESSNQPETKSVPARRMFRLPEGYFTLRFYEFLSSGISFLGFVGLIVTLLINISSLHENDHAIQKNIDLMMNNWSFDLDKVFIESPQLRIYFFDTVCINPEIGSEVDSFARREGHHIERVENNVYYKVVSISDLTTDCFDGILSNREYFKDKQKRVYWIRWIYDSFTRSPVLCRTFVRTRGWYGDEINMLFEDWDKRVPIDQVILHMQKAFYK